MTSITIKETYIVGESQWSGVSVHHFVRLMLQGIDFFMSSCTVFVFCSLMEYAVVNVVLGDLVDSDESYLRRGMKNISRKQANNRRPRTTLSVSMLRPFQPCRTTDKKRENV
jgi:hypothetical protein